MNRLAGSAGASLLLISMVIVTLSTHAGQKNDADDLQRNQQHQGQVQQRHQKPSHNEQVRKKKGIANINEQQRQNFHGATPKQRRTAVHGHEDEWSKNTNRRQQKRFNNDSSDHRTHLEQNYELKKRGVENRRDFKASLSVEQHQKIREATKQERKAVIERNAAADF